MARKPRFNLPGIPQHVIQRDNNRDPCFLADGDYRRYLANLLPVARRRTDEQSRAANSAARVNFVGGQMIWFVLTRSGYDELVAFSSKAPAVLWINHGVLSSQELEQLQKMGMEVTDFTQ